jgi:hypothetical protein
MYFMVSNVTPETIVVRDSEPTSVVVAGHLVLLSVREGSYFDFNEVGSEIWNMLGEPRRVLEICEFLSHNYAISAEIILTDVINFLQTLTAHNLITVIPMCQRNE